jgi:hypothetical protein
VVGAKNWKLVAGFRRSNSVVESQPSRSSRLAGVSEAGACCEILSEAKDLKLCSSSGRSGSNSVVESQPSKLLVAGSIPVSRSRNMEAR